MVDRFNADFGIDTGTQVYAFTTSTGLIRVFYKDKIKQRLKENAKIEQIDYFKLLTEEFSQENGFLTPTLKLKPYKILKKYN